MRMLKQYDEASCRCPDASTCRRVSCCLIVPGLTALYLKLANVGALLSVLHVMIAPAALQQQYIAHRPTPPATPKRTFPRFPFPSDDPLPYLLFSLPLRLPLSRFLGGGGVIPPGFGIWNFVFYFGESRVRLGASLATGLVGTKENLFLADFFGCMGFLPLTCKRYDMYMP